MRRRVLERQIQMKIRKENKLVWKLRVYILGRDILKYGLALLLLLVPLTIAASSIWLNLLITILKQPYSNWLTENKNTLDSIFGVLAGAYLTIYATYIIERKKVL